MEYELQQDARDAPQIERKWITVDEAFMLCQEAGLDRTKKTIRSWCRHEHVEGRKQTTPNGERWMLEARSLEVKIRSELEFQRQSAPVQTSANQGEPVRTEVQPTDTPVQTRAHQYEQVQPRAHAPEPNQERSSQNDLAQTERIAELEREVRSLEIDKAVRDRQVEFLTKQNEEGQNNLLSQSRFIGHLETQLLQLGGRADQQFLSAPIPRENAGTHTSSPQAEYVQPHPKQSQFDIHTNPSDRQ